MDCDYDPNNLQKELVENSKGKRKRRRKSKFAKMISEPRPLFDPNDKSYAEYIDEYYKFDCEDIIGDIPCRFKYRQVVPNSFGLSIEEILLAKDRELNRWCSLKKAVQYRPENQERYDQIAYERKGKNFDLKKKILTSLFEPVENEKEETSEEQLLRKDTLSDDLRKSKTKDKNDVKVIDSNDLNKETNGKISDKQNKNESTSNTKKKRKKGSINDEVNYSTVEENNDKGLNCSEIKEEKAKPKKKKKIKNVVESNELVEACKEDIFSNASNKVKDENIRVLEPKKKIKKHKHRQETQASSISEDQLVTERSNAFKNNKRKMNDNKEVAFKKQKRFGNKKTSDVDIGISDARLSAYGFNAKKFKNKLKYGNKNK